MTQKWDFRHLNLAREIASWSKDPKRKVGSVIVREPNNDPVSYGYNGFPAHIDDTDERLNDDTFRRAHMIHSEMNAIYRANSSLDGTTIFVWPFLACRPCAIGILGNNINRLVTTDYAPSHWVEEFDQVKQLLTQHIEVMIYPMSAIRSETSEYDPANPKK